MRIRLWLGVGSWAMASSLASAAPVDDPTRSLASPAQAEMAPSGEAPRVQGGIDDGGEGGEGGVPAGPTTEGLGMTSDRLVAQWSVQPGTPPEIAGAHDRGGHQAAAALRESAVGWLVPTGEAPPQPKIEAILALLNRASAEYAAAVAGGRIKEPLEYHDSRGLFVIARQAFERQHLAGDRSAQGERDEPERGRGRHLAHRAEREPAASRRLSLRARAGRKDAAACHASFRSTSRRAVRATAWSPRAALSTSPTAATAPAAASAVA
jgi:hypothetical protein